MSRWSALLVLLAGPAFGAAGAEELGVAFTARCDGAEQRYVLRLPAGFDAGRPHEALIARHGHGPDRWQFMRRTRDETRAVLDVASRRRLILVSPDYRALTSWMGPKAEADLTQIIGELRVRYRIGRVFLCGGSMGGSSALTYAALHPDLIDGVASMNGTANHLEYENFQDSIRASFGGTKLQIPQEYKVRSAEYWPERFTMPVSITASGADSIVPPHSVLRLAVLEKLGRQVLLLCREKEGHRTAYAGAAIEFAISKTGER